MLKIIEKSPKFKTFFFSKNLSFMSSFPCGAQGVPRFLGTPSIRPCLHLHLQLSVWNKFLPKWTKNRAEFSIRSDGIIENFLLRQGAESSRRNTFSVGCRSRFRSDSVGRSVGWMSVRRVSVLCGLSPLSAPAGSVQLASGIRWIPVAKSLDGLV